MQVPSTVAPLGQPQAGFNPSQTLTHTSVTAVALAGGPVITNLPTNTLPSNVAVTAGYEAAVPATYAAVDALAVENFGGAPIFWMPIAQGAAVPGGWAGLTAGCPGGLEVMPNTSALYVPGFTMGDPLAVIIWSPASGLVKVRRGFQINLIA